MPWYDPNKDYHKIRHYKEPIKFDCKIKNFRRKFLREMFTEWHDSNSELSIEEYCDLHHYSVKWCRKNINKDLSLDEIIEIMKKIMIYLSGIRYMKKKNIMKDLKSLNIF